MNGKVLKADEMTSRQRMLAAYRGGPVDRLPFWAKVPFGDPGIMSIGHEIALETAAHYFPDEIIAGNLDPAIIQTGMPEEIYEATRINSEEGKKLPNGYIFSPGCEIPPMASREQIMAMTDAIHDHGWYN